jgi:hypothetical protein
MIEAHVKRLLCFKNNKKATVARNTITTTSSSSLELYANLHK